MGVDCEFIAENKNRITLADIEKDSLAGKFPAGTGKIIEEKRAIGSRPMPSGFRIDDGRWGICFLEIRNDLVIVHDGCRLESEHREYQQQMVDYLRKKCGGRAGLFPDISDVPETYDTAEKITAVCKSETPHGDWWQPGDYS